MEKPIVNKVKRVVGLAPDDVRRLMSSMQPVHVQDDYVPKNDIERAYDMIKKSNSTLACACQSYKVKKASVIKYAKDNNLPMPWAVNVYDEEAKKIADRLIESGAHIQNLRHGLKQRVAYLLALKVGVSEACRRINIDRRGLYYYCKNYELPTPCRAIK
jgi:uncharacterized protein (UPF0147 family)